MTFRSRIILIIFVCIAALVLVTKINQPKLLTGNVNEINKIVVTLSPFNKPATFSVEKEQDIFRIYEIILKTHNMTIKRHPNHSDGDVSDSKIYLTIYYIDGNSDFLKTGENPYFLFRPLETEGTGGKGYVGGDNETLWDYLNNIKDEYEANPLAGIVDTDGTN